MAASILFLGQQEADIRQGQGTHVQKFHKIEKVHETGRRGSKFTFDRLPRTRFCVRKLMVTFSRPKKKSAQKICFKTNC